MLSNILGTKLFQITGDLNEIGFWQKYSTLTTGTITDYMDDALTQRGFTGTPSEKLREWLKAVGMSGGTVVDDANALITNGLTFYKDFTRGTTLNADFSLGSGVGTFTRAAGDTSTYTDSSGNVLAATATLPRFVGGVYDQDGFNSTKYKPLPATATSWNQSLITRPVNAPISSSYLFRGISLVGTTYYMWLEYLNGTNWECEYRTSSDGLTWSAQSASLFALGGAGTFNEKGNADPTVIYDGAGDWKMWVDSLNGGGTWHDIGYSTSADGATWSAPVSVMQIGGAGAWDDDFIHHPCVIKSGSTYYMYYAGHSSANLDWKIGLATSPDGTTWTKYGTTPIISPDGTIYDYNRPGHPFKIGSTWYMFVWASLKASPYESRWKLYSSSDLYTWTYTGTIFLENTNAVNSLGNQANQVITDLKGNLRLYGSLKSRDGSYYFNQFFYLQGTPYTTRGLLIERASTNLVPKSYTYNDATWDLTDMTASDNSATSPDGTADASTLTATANNGTCVLHTAVTAQCYSVFLKRKTGTSQVYITANSGTTWLPIYVSSNWNRVYVIKASASQKCGIKISNNGDEVYAWVSQFEDIPYMTSPIPTTNGALTRNVESLTYPTASNRTAGAESMFMKILFGQNTVNNSIARIFIDDDTTGGGTRKSIQKLSTATTLVYYPNGSTSSCYANTTTSPELYNSYVLGAINKLSGNYANIYVDGISEATDSTHNPGTLKLGTNFYIGSRYSSTLQGDSIYQKIAFFNIAEDDGTTLKITNILNNQ